MSFIYQSFYLSFFLSFFVHKLRWGKENCKVMKVGKHRNNENDDWKIGDMTINETKSYKYLGDIITEDGKNTKKPRVQAKQDHIYHHINKNHCLK